MGSFHGPCWGLTLLMLLTNASFGLPVNRASYKAAQLINGQGPYIGLIMADQSEEEVLIAANIFIPHNEIPWLDFAGRRFNIGSINEEQIIYVRCGERRLNAAVTTQMLVDIFDIAGVVHYGTAGNANNSLSIGDVSVPKYFAYTGSWTWTEFGANEAEQFQDHLHFGDYNVPLGNKTNLLSNVVFGNEDFFSEESEMKEIFWLEATTQWFHVASKLKDLRLEACINTTICLPEIPKVIVGLNASSADIFVDNAAYREFLFNRFQVASVDEESAAIVMVCLSNKVPVIVFRGLSDLAGAGAGAEKGIVSSIFSSLAAKNALRAAVAFFSMMQKDTEVEATPNLLQFANI